VKDDDDLAIFFQNGGHRRLRFLNFQKFNGRKGDDCKDAAFHLLCTKAEVSEYRKAYWFLVVIMEISYNI